MPKTEKKEAIVKVPYVVRSKGAENGWETVVLHIQGDMVIEREKVHGPDTRRICLAKAKLLMRE